MARHWVWDEREDGQFSIETSCKNRDLQKEDRTTPNLHKLRPQVTEWRVKRYNGTIATDSRRYRPASSDRGTCRPSRALSDLLAECAIAN